MTQVTPEFCEKVIRDYTAPLFEANMGGEGSNFSRREGSLLVVAVPDGFDLESARSGLKPDQEFYKQYVVHEHTWGENQIGASQVQEDSFTRKALQKAFGSLYYHENYDEVIARHPRWVAAHGLIEYAGAVFTSVTLKDGSNTDFVTSYSGLWWWHDELLASTTSAGIKAELLRRDNGE